MCIYKIQNLSPLTGHLAVFLLNPAYGLCCIGSDVGDNTLHAVNFMHILQNGFHGF